MENNNQDQNKRVNNQAVPLNDKFLEEQFDKVSLTYGYRFSATGLITLRKRVRCLVANLLDYKENILDIGVGNGLIFPYLRNKDIDYTGLDLSSKMLEKSIERAMQEGLRFYPVLSNVLKLPFKNHSFNSVICIDTLHHLNPSELFMALEEIIRVTNKEGQIIIEIKNSFNLLLCLVYWLESKRKSLPLYPINPLSIIKFLKQKRLFYHVYFVGPGFWLAPFIVFDIRV